jgi:hypothetical protein
MRGEQNYHYPAALCASFEPNEFGPENSGSKSARQATSDGGLWYSEKRTAAMIFRRID